MSATTKPRTAHTRDTGIERLQTMLADDLNAIETLLQARTASPTTVIPDLSAHIVSAGGKRIRPILTLTAAHACGGVGRNAHTLAAAVEFIHTATLLHDDVVDNSSLRRGRAAARNIWGNQASILVGDFLFARAFTLMVATGNIEILDILSHTASIIAEGEIKQLATANRIDLTVTDYLDIIEAKTAALFAAAARTGALSAGEQGKIHADTLAVYGKNLGMAFQMIDDVLDYGDTHSAIGKRVGDDFREGKLTLPVIIACQHASTDDLAFWGRVMAGKQEENDLAHAIHLIHSTGAKAETVARARDHVNLAKAALGKLPDNVWSRALSEVADFCINRIC